MIQPLGALEQTLEINRKLDALQPKKRFGVEGILEGCGIILRLNDAEMRAVTALEECIA